MPNVTSVFLSRVLASTCVLALACHAQTSDARGAVEQVLIQAAGSFSVPIGKTRLDDKTLALVGQLQRAGLVVVSQIPQAYWDSYLNRTQGLGTPVQIAGTSKLMSLNPPVIPVAGQELRIFRVKIADVRIDEVTTDQDYSGPLATPGEKYRLILGTFLKVPTEVASVLGPALAAQSEDRSKFRSIVKYNQFAKTWQVIAFDTGLLNTDTWLSSNVR